MSKLISDLEKLGVLRQGRLEIYYPRVRDRDDVAVLRDPVTEVIVLSSTDHVSEEYYEEREERDTYDVHGVEMASTRLEDNLRRKADFGAYIRNKRWLDFGCGLGGMLDEMAVEANWAAGLEPNRERASVVASKGHRVVGSLAELENECVDVVTMFHVLEHLADPIPILEAVRRVLRPGGTLLVEVPHARDALFTLYDCEAFRRFTFWSEHLVLHTRLSLRALLVHTGFTDIEVTGYQRYPLANHLYWLSRQRPGGHDVWRFFSSDKLHEEYEGALVKLDRTDSLVAASLNR